MSWRRVLASIIKWHMGWGGVKNRPKKCFVLFEWPQMCTQIKNIEFQITFSDSNFKLTLISLMRQFNCWQSRLVFEFLERKKMFCSKYFANLLPGAAVKRLQYVTQIVGHFTHTPLSDKHTHTHTHTHGHYL